MRAVLLLAVLASSLARAQETAPPPPWPAPDQAATEEQATPIPPPPAAARTEGPSPVPPPPAERVLPALLFFPALRIQLGAAFLFSPTIVRQDFTLDLQAGLRIIFRDTPGGVASTDATVGYSFIAGSLGGHLLTLGGSLLFGNPVAAVGPCAYFVVGQMIDRFTAGIRAGARADFFLGVLGLEVGYEGRFSDGLTVHELRLMIASEGLAMLLAAAVIR